MPNLFRLASKIAISLRLLLNDAQTVYCKHTMSSFYVNPTSITCCASACCYNISHHFKIFFKVSLQLNEDSELQVIKGDCSAILAECGHMFPCVTQCFV